MRTYYLKFCFIILGVIGFMTSCSKDENENKPLTANGAVPGQVGDIRVNNLSGKSILTYDVPDDPNILSVRATYILDTGVKREVKSSYYKDSLVIDGFANAGKHEVKVSTISRSEVESEPVTVEVNPKDSALKDVFKSLEVGPDFGGVFIKALNPKRDQLAILYLKKNDQGDWETTGNSIYTSTDSIFRAVRGLDTLNYDLAFTIRDRFLNTSDTLFKTIKPIFEEQLPINKFRGYRLPGDATQNNFPHGLNSMWDGEFVNWPKIYITDAGFPGPHSFTIDLGQSTKVSRVKIWDHPQSSTYYYWNFDMRKLEIWGSSNPSADGSYDSWDLLGTFEVKKPSGLPLGQQTNEDVQLARDGWSWPIPITAPKYRYIRVKCLEDWGGIGQLAVAELRVYGDTR